MHLRTKKKQDKEIAISDEQWEPEAREALRRPGGLAATFLLPSCKTDFASSTN